MAVKRVLRARFADSKRAIWAVTSYETVPATGVEPGPVTVKVAGLIVELSIAVLKNAMTSWSMNAPTAPFAGMVEVTVGRDSVVKVQ